MNRKLALAPPHGSRPEPVSYAAPNGRYSDAAIILDGRGGCDHRGSENGIRLNDLRAAGGVYGCAVLLVFDLPDFAEQFERVDACVVAVAELDGVGVGAHGLHAEDFERPGFGGREHRQ